MRVEKSLEGKQRSTAGKLRGDLRLGQSPGFLSFFLAPSKITVRDLFLTYFSWDLFYLDNTRAREGNELKAGKVHNGKQPP